MQITDIDPQFGSHAAFVERDPDPFSVQFEMLMSPELALSEATLVFWSRSDIHWCRSPLNNCELLVWIILGEVGGGDDLYVGKADDDWLYVQVDGTPCRRETNTMPQWAGSCWYYLRYCDPGNTSRFIDPDVERYWSGGDPESGMIDLYVGGIEHAVLVDVADLGVTEHLDAFGDQRALGDLGEVARVGRQHSRAALDEDDRLVDLAGRRLKPDADLLEQCRHVLDAAFQPVVVTVRARFVGQAASDVVGHDAAVAIAECLYLVAEHVAAHQQPMRENDGFRPGSLLFVVNFCDVEFLDGHVGVLRSQYSNRFRGMMSVIST